MICHVDYHPSGINDIFHILNFCTFFEIALFLVWANRLEENNGENNVTGETHTLNHNVTIGTSSNSSGIMHNTSGIIDDAFDAIWKIMANY